MICFLQHEDKLEQKDIINFRLHIRPTQKCCKKTSLFNARGKHSNKTKNATVRFTTWLENCLESIM